MSKDMRQYTTDGIAVMVDNLNALREALIDEMDNRLILLEVIRGGRYGGDYTLGHQDGFDGIQPRLHCIDEYYDGYMDGMELTRRV